MDSTKGKKIDEVIPCIRPVFELDEEWTETIASLLASGRVSNNGEQVQSFERLLAEYLGVSETVAVSNGSDALLLALKALDLPRGKAILPAYTYIATLNAVVHAGLDPLFCDAEANSFTMDTSHLSELLKGNPDVRCVLPVNVFGVPPKLGAIRLLCDSAGSRMVYDNAHGFGTEVDGRRITLEAEIQTYSFHATKTLPAVEGGLVVSKDSSIVSKVRRLRNHGLGGSPAETTSGFNAKMDEIRSVIGIHSLRHFEESLARRRQYGHRLREAFQRFPAVYTVQGVPEGVNSNFQNLGVCCPPAAQRGLATVLALFQSRGVGVRSYFDPPLYKFAGFDRRPPLPSTESIWRTLISAPIHSRMTESVLVRIETVVAEVAGMLKN